MFYYSKISLDFKEFIMFLSAFSFLFSSVSRHGIAFCIGLMSFCHEWNVYALREEKYEQTFEEQGF